MLHEPVRRKVRLLEQILTVTNESIAMSHPTENIEATEETSEQAVDETSKEETAAEENAEVRADSEGSEEEAE